MPVIGKPSWWAIAMAGIAWSFIGCKSTTPAANEEPPPPDAQDGYEATEDAPSIPAGFSWVIPDQLAGMARPGSQGDLEQDLAFLKSEGIGLLVSLTETQVSSEIASRYDIWVQHIPVEDFQAPTLLQLHYFVALADSWIADQEPVAVHCQAGLGRTGTFLAAFLVWRGQSPEDAVAEVRRLRPGSIETQAQLQSVYDFHQSLDRR